MDAWNLRSPVHGHRHLHLRQLALLRRQVPAEPEQVVGGDERLERVALHPDPRRLPVAVLQEQPQQPGAEEADVVDRLDRPLAGGERRERDDRGTEEVRLRFRRASPTSTWSGTRARRRATTPCSSSSTSWTDTLHAAGFKSGVYSSGSAAIAALDAAKGVRTQHDLPRPPLDRLDEQGGQHRRRAVPARLAVGQPPAHPPVPQRRQRLVRRIQGQRSTRTSSTSARARWPRRSPSRATSRCRSAATRASTRVTPASQVSALQCLLKERGYSVSVNGTFGSSTSQGDRRLPQVARLGPDRRPHHQPDLDGAALGRLQAARAQARVGRRSGLAPAASPHRRGRRASRSTASMTARPCRPSRRTAARTALTAYETTESSVWSLLQRGKLG